ncbi:MAG: hypothetical protein ACOCYE_04930, partial [Pseudomonadota bacterium]
MGITLHDDVPFLANTAFLPAAEISDTRLVRLLADADALYVNDPDDAPPPPSIEAAALHAFACIRDRGARHSFRHKRAAARALVTAFEHHYGAQAALTLVDQHDEEGPYKLAILTSVKELIELRHILAGFRP